MAVCVTPDVNNYLVADITTVADCTAYVLVDSNEYQLMIQSYDITPFEILQAFTWGFGTYITFWFLTYCVKNGKSLIRMI